MDQKSLIASLQATIDNVLRPILARANRVAVLGYPAHPNVGDSAIWLGQIAYLRNIGGKICYTCHRFTYSREQLAKRIGDGIILFQGGGSIGDIYEGEQRFFEQVIQDFPNNPIVHLPQSIHFKNPAALDRARKVYDAHQNLTLIIRDRVSLQLAREQFRAPSLLCPDMAFCLGPLARPQAPTQPIVWLARTDREASQSEHASPIPTVDWLKNERPTLTIRFEQWLRAQAVNRPRVVGPRVQAPLGYLANRITHQRLERGCAMLGAGRVVITDRLHAHIMSILLGIPHVAMDNSTGKVRNFYETWTQTCELAHWANTPAHATAIAAEIEA